MPKVCLQTFATIALIFVLIQLAEAEYGYHPRRPPFIPAPRSRSAPPQHCGNGFVQNLKGDPTPHSTLTFHHCQRIGDNGEVEASDQTIQPTRFEADNKAKTLSRRSISVHPQIARFRVLMDELHSLFDY
ncbi:hypothetical protein PGT21_005280 [Puccinia graminis f. sp. tritici]|uniref:Uncharacterized protein n=1 Tax=Puccinia graminis f. sp. tritici TaxID=56615 RepID=A0A5B0QMI2_PUCGR|nr:hypothetical protein PGT21_005280 [Puccinia graminis f. sp. tritici]